MKTILRALELILLCALFFTKSNAQTTACRTPWLDLGTGYNFETLQPIPANQFDPFWRIANGPSNQGPYPRCAVGLGYTAGNYFAPSSAVSISSAAVSGNMIPALNNCNYTDQPYTFERDFQVVNTNSIPSILQLEWVTVDYSISTILLLGPGGPYTLFAGCLPGGIHNLPSHNLNLATGKYSLQICIGNNWQSNWAPSPLSLQIKAFVYATQSIFVDNKHFGRNESCSPPYPAFPPPTLANTCVAFNDTMTEVVIDNYISGLTYSVSPSSMNSLFTFPATLNSTYTVSATDAFGCVQQTTVTILPCTMESFYMKIHMQGYYAGNDSMHAVLFQGGLSSSPTDVDSVTIILRSSSPPYAVVRTAQATVQADGWVEFNFSPIMSNYYYIEVRGRNTLAAWTPFPIACYQGMEVDLTSSAGTMLGNLLQEVESGIWALPSGDINQDETIDSADYLLLDTDISNTNSGWLTTDLNGDGSVDSYDYLLLDGNLQQGLTTWKPD
jgi:hypothetical protein